MVLVARESEGLITIGLTTLRTLITVRFLWMRKVVIYVDGCSERGGVLLGL